MGKFKMNCGYCGRKCSLEKDFCIPQDSVYICKSCYEWKQKVDDLEAKLAEKEKLIEDSIDVHEIEEKNIYKLRYELAGANEEIARLREENEELKKGVYKVTLGTTPSNQINFTENFYVIQNQTAIAELEKVKEYWLKHEDIGYYIDQQIKKIKGENK